MASHLTVTTSTAGVSTSKPFGAEADSGTPDVFAALLGTAGQPEAKPAAASDAGASLASAINMSLGFGGEGAEQSEDPEAIAAVIDAITPIETAPLYRTQLTELVEGLADLKASLEAGEPLDAETLKRLDAALSDLASRLGIDLANMPTPDELTALLAGADTGGDGLSDKLVAAFGPLTGALLGHTDPTASAELSAQVKSLGDKLAAMLASLNNGELDADALAQLDLNADASLDAELQAALARLASPAPKLDATATPAIATPELKLTEPVLTGKADLAEAAAPADNSDETPDATPPVAGADGRETRDRDTDARSGDRKSDAAAPPATAAPVDKPLETQAGMPPAQAARADAVAAPRVVQAGYQTSQQQLNLPQLAFELGAPGQ